MLTGTCWAHTSKLHALTLRASTPLHPHPRPAVPSWHIAYLMAVGACPGPCTMSWLQPLGMFASLVVQAPGGGSGQRNSAAPHGPAADMASRQAAIRLSAPTPSQVSLPHVLVQRPAGVCKETSRSHACEASQSLACGRWREWLLKAGKEGAAMPVLHAPFKVEVGTLVLQALSLPQWQFQ
jgi:hypothetical protein